MVSVEITLEILDEIEKALDLGFDKMYVNVDDLENGYGFLRVLAMRGTRDLIVFEGNSALHTCYEVLELLERSKYDIKDFTMEGKR